MKTKVIFRKYRDGDILALFPELPADIYGHNCESYQHIGQHGAASTALTAVHTVKATPEEYADLHAELTAIGYDLQVCHRRTQAMDKARYASAARALK